MFICYCLLLEVILCQILLKDLQIVTLNRFHCLVLSSPFQFLLPLQTCFHHEKIDLSAFLSFFQTHKTNEQFIQMCLEPFQLNFAFYTFHLLLAQKFYFSATCPLNLLQQNKEHQAKVFSHHQNLSKIQPNLNGYKLLNYKVSFQNHFLVIPERQEHYNIS